MVCCTYWFTRCLKDIDILSLAGKFLLAPKFLGFILFPLFMDYHFKTFSIYSFHLRRLWLLISTQMIFESRWQSPKQQPSPSYQQNPSWYTKITVLRQDLPLGKKRDWGLSCDWLCLWSPSSHLMKYEYQHFIFVMRILQIIFLSC